ncbi:MFS transporter [Caldicellulosiruptoraceae bacterium PP1]
MSIIKDQFAALVESFKMINKNTKRVLLFEPFFTIPYGMFVIYSSIYMTRMGVKDYQIGILSTVLNLVMLLSAPIAGILANRLGRKKTLFIGDFLAWVLYAYIFFFAKDFKWFLIATIFNGLTRIPEIAWRLLLIEDATENERVAIYSLTVFIWNIGSLFAPLMGILVAKFGVIHATRGVILAFAILVNVLILVRHLITSETSVGRTTLKENENKERSITKRFIEYKETIIYIIKKKELLLIMLVIVLNNFNMIFRDTYRNLYLTERLKFADDIISTFPTISAIITIIFILIAIPTLKDKNHDKVLLYGIILISISNLIFLFAPSGIIGFILVIFVVLLNAIGSAIYAAFVDAIFANSIEDHKRAYVFSASMVIISLLSMPMGAIAGQLYSISKIIPFIIAFISTSLCIVLIYKKISLTENIVEK